MFLENFFLTLVILKVVYVVSLIITFITGYKYFRWIKKFSHMLSTFLLSVIVIIFLWVFRHEEHTVVPKQLAFHLFLQSLTSIIESLHEMVGLIV
jgi:hypothetical protein